MMQKINSKTSLKSRLEPYWYLLPSLLFFAVFLFYPFAKTIVLSLFTVTAKGTVKEFAGIQNYIKVFSDPNFVKSIWNTILYVLLASPVSIAFSLMLALLANKKTKTSAIYETLYSMTMAMSVSVTAMIFKIMFNPSIGIINKVFHTSINWLNDPNVAMISLGIISIWMNLGYNFLFLLAAIRSIPEEIIESANLEGANIFQKLRRIILPIISPTVFFLICSSLAKNIIMTSLPIILTDGGPQGSTATMIFYMYNQAFRNGNYNTAYAAAIVTFVFSLIAILFSFRFERKGVHYQ